MLDAVAELSLLRRGPPVPHVRLHLFAANSSRLRAAPHGRAGSEGMRAFEAVVPPEEQDPRRIVVRGFLDLVEHRPNALHRHGLAAPRLAGGFHEWVCDPPV